MKGRNQGGYILSEIALGAKTCFLAKTSDYTVKYSDCGKIITTAGATGTVTFTLPAVKRGMHFFFLNLVNQNMVIVADTADTLITYNDTQADSIAFQTDNQKIGALAWVVCDGSNWVAINVGTHTCTVST